MKFDTKEMAGRYWLTSKIMTQKDNSIIIKECLEKNNA